MGRLREGLRWYPADLDRYVLAVAWAGLARYVPLHQRADQRGYHRQSRLLAASLATELIRLAFLVCREWTPYDKWVQARFERLPVAVALAGPLDRLVDAAGWAERDAALGLLLDAQRERGRATPAVGLVPFYDRAATMIAPEVTELLLDAITDPQVLARPLRLGTIEQWATGFDVVFNLDRRPGFVDAYRAWTAH